MLSNMLNLPASETKCRTLRIPHIGIEFAILEIPFRLEFHGVVESRRVMQYGPKHKSQPGDTAGLMVPDHALPIRAVPFGI